MRILTLTQLTARRACAPQAALFKRHFGESVVVTEKLAAAHAPIFGSDSASYHLLTRTAQAAFDKVCAPAQAQYVKRCRVAGAERDKVRASIWGALDKTGGLALTEYAEETAPAWAEFDKVCASAWDEFEKIRAVAFAKLYNSDQI